MGKNGKYVAPSRKRPGKSLGILAAILIVVLIGTLFFLRKDQQETPEPVLQKKTPYPVTSILRADDVEWAQATIWKDTGVHLFLKQQQISDIIDALNQLEESSFEQIKTGNILSVMLYYADKEVLLHYDGERVEIGFDSDTATNMDPGSWSVSDSALKEILDPIVQLDNTKQWINYMTAYDIKNLCLQKDSVTWEFFEDFAYRRTGADEVQIPVEDHYFIHLAGSEGNRPVSMHLVENDNPQNRVDIRTSDAESLLAYVLETGETSAADPEESGGLSGVEPISVFDTYYNEEQAMIDGCVVMRDGDLRENQANWQRFVETTQAGSAASVQVVHYTRDDSGTTYIPYAVIFDGEIYTLKIATESQQVSCTFTGLEMTTGVMNQQSSYDRYIRYSLTGGTDTADVVIVEDRISTPKLENISAIALHLKQGEPPLNVYEDPSEMETILKLLKEAEYEMVPPEGYILGVKLILHTQDGQEVILEVDIIQGIYRYGTQYYRYGELPDLFQVLGISQWPEEVRQEYSSYL